MRSCVLTLALLWGLTASPLAYHSVKGTVRNRDGAVLAGAVVQIKNTRTVPVRSFITREDGAYRFYRLDPEVDYELKASYKSFYSPAEILSQFASHEETVTDLKVEVQDP